MRRVLGIVAVACAGCAGVSSDAKVAPSPDVVAHTPSPEETEPPPPEPKVLFVPGESAAYKVRWFDVLMGGMTLVVGGEGHVEGRRVIVVRIGAHTAGLLAKVKPARSELAAELDIATGIPLRVAGDIDDLYSGDIMRRDYVPKEVDLDWRPFDAEIATGVLATETAGGVGIIRAWQGAKGERTHFYGIVRGMHFRTDLLARGPEAISLEIGNVRTQRIDGVVTRVRGMQPDPTEKYRFIMWLSDDDHRVPLRVHVESHFGGVVEIDLASYRGGGLVID